MTATQAPSVIVQQYSSATFVSLPFHSIRENLDARLTDFVFQIFLILLKLHNCGMA
jgi:hypothetical protein